MGEVIPFRAPAVRRPPWSAAYRAAMPEELAVIAAVESGGGHADMLAAAGPLLGRLNVDYGFAVMRRGLPEEPGALANALLLLSRALAAIGPGTGRRPAGAYGVYFGRSPLAWFEDGYGGETGLAVPTGIGVAELAAFIEARLSMRRHGT